MKLTNNFIALRSLVILGLTFLVSTAPAQEPWMKKTDMSTARSGLSACAVDGKIYAIGGATNSSGSGILSTVEMYDPITDIWTPKASMSTARFVHASAAVNGIIYVFAGDSASEGSVEAVEAYDPVTDIWTTKSNMSFARGAHRAATVNGKIYVIGGASGPPFKALWTNEEYDPATDTWTRKANMPIAKWGFATSVVDGIIYVIGGQSSGGSWSSSVHAYNPATDKWGKKTSMPTGRTHISACAVNGIIYIIGGGTNPSTTLSIVEAYNPVTDSWTQKADMPTRRCDYGIGVVNEKIYVIGGAKSWGSSSLSILEEYNPSQDLTEYVKTVHLSTCYAKAGSDSICIFTELNETDGVSLSAEIQAPDQAPLGSLQLYDDGNHDDVFAGDSLYANTWMITSAEEQHYYVDLIVKRLGAETAVHHMDNMAAFTTVGPIEVDSCYAGPTDDEPNPGDSFKFGLTLKNRGATATASDIRAVLSCSHEKVDIISNNKRFNDIVPGAQESNIGWYAIKIDENCPQKTQLSFNVDISSNGYTFWSDTFSLYTDQVVGVKNSAQQKPTSIRLYQNYPNPFNPQTCIRYELAKTSHVQLKILNLLGQDIRLLVNDIKASGSHECMWDGKDNLGETVPAGIYFYRLITNAYCCTRKMALVK